MSKKSRRKIHLFLTLPLRKDPSFPKNWNSEAGFARFRHQIFDIKAS